MGIMEAVRGIPRRLGRALGRREFERQLDDELRFHVDAESAELVRRGVEPAEARRRAMAALGGLDRWRDEVRETRVTHWLEVLGRDVRLSLRMLGRRPSYTLPVLLTMALGIAAMASIATVAYDVIFRPLPYREPERLVAVFERNIPRKRDRNVVSVTALEAWKQRSRTLDSASGLMPSSRVWLSGAGPVRVSGAEVSPSLFELLGRRPVLGPGFSTGTPVNEVIVSHRFWIDRLGADSSIIGKSIRLDGAPVTVVGVMGSDFEPLRFGWMGEQEYWLPFTPTPQSREWGRFLLVAARLRAGATLEQANRELESIHAQLRTEGSIAEGWDAHTFVLSDEMSDSVRAPFMALLAACALLLAMLLTNTALLTMAEARTRAMDRALRLVLGATRARLSTERLVTSLLLALGGGALGLALAAWAIPALTRLLPVDVPRLDQVSFGEVAVLVGVGTAALAAMLIAIVPALDQRRAGTSALQAGARMTSRSHTSWVVITETATAVVLTLFAGLTLRSFNRLASVDAGFDPSHLLAFRVSFEGPGVSQPAAVAASREFFRMIRIVPGVASAGRTSVRPFNLGGTSTTVTPPGQSEKDQSKFPTAAIRFVDAEYFQTLGLAPLAGRIFSTSDRADGPVRAVVNESLLKALFPEGGNVLGRTFDVRVNGTLRPEIVGVVRDVRLTNLRMDPRPTVYFFTEQQTAGEEYDVLVRTQGDELAILPGIRNALKSVAADVPLFRVESMRRTADQTIARERVTAQLLVFFATAALLLVAVGVYGLYAGDVARRRREIGVRMALGETPARVVASMLGQALARTALGLVVGGAAGVLMTRGLQSILYGVAPNDPATYAGAAAIVVAVAVGATLIPARKASAVQPSSALRAE